MSLLNVERVKLRTWPAVSMMSSWYSWPLCLTSFWKVFSIVG